mmetsp:Transcript_10430/g.18033  ORF Transcript_10430/g.18033 Transcript_10430/m.18033 type:complete len:1232 (+) Transcript_10430:125-3820(+)
MWAPEENRQLKELRERLGMAARLESNMETLGSANSSCSASGSAPATAASESFAVGHRVRVIRGRKFHDFGAGDAGTVLRVDADGGVCTVAFDARAEPLQVAMRHLEAEPARRQLRTAPGAFESAAKAQDQATLEQTSAEYAATSLESGEEQCHHFEVSGGDGILCAAALNLKVELPTAAGTGLHPAVSSMGTLEARPALGATGETPSLALLSGESDSRRLRMADSGTGSSAGCMRRSASQPAAEQRILETVPRTDVPSSGILASPLRATQGEVVAASCSSERLPFRTHHGASLGMALSSAWPSATLPPAPSQLDADPAVGSTVQNAGAPSSNQDIERSLERSAECQDPLRKEAAELRRAADAAAAAEYRREAALFIEQQVANVAAREEAEALAEAVQASAHATATATATAMVEVAALRAEVRELQTQLSKEAEQRALSVREVERGLEQLRAKQERNSTDAEEAIKAEQKRLSRKQAELVSLCLSLQKDQQQQDLEPPADASIDWEQWEQRFATLDHGLEVAMRSQERAAEQLRSLEEFSTSSMEERRLFEERLAALEAGANDLNMALGTLDTLDDARGVERMAREEMDARLEQKERRLMEVERRLLEVDSGVLVGAERLESLCSRTEALAAGLALKADREASPAAAGRIDALASRIDTLVMDLAAKAERETPATALASVHVVEALSARMDRLTETLGTLGAEITRLEALHRDGMQEGATALADAVHAAEQREAEQLQRLSAEVERHAAELREAAAEVEHRASEAIKIGQRAREALEAHCEITDDRHNAVEALRTRIDSIGEGLAVEARLREESLASETRLREEAVQRVEAQCRQAREDAANAAPAAAAAATSAAGVNANAMERQLMAVLTEVRSDAERAESGRREESQRRREAEVALQRLRGEIDVLREELMRRSAVGPMSSPPTVMEAVTPAELPQSGALRAAAAMAVPEGPPSVTPKTTPPAPPARVMRFSSGPARERPQHCSAEVFRWPSPLRGQQTASPPREKTAVPVLVESAVSPRRAASTANRMTSAVSSPPREPLGRRTMVAGGAAAAAPVTAVPRVSIHGAPRDATPTQSGRALALPAAPAPVAEQKTSGIPAATCSFCGNTFMHDAVFCRKCGAKRGMEETPRMSAAMPGGAPGHSQESVPQQRQGMIRAASAGTLRTQGASQPLPASAVVTLAAPSWPSGIASGRTLSPTTEARTLSSATISMSMESNVTTATAQLDEVMS